MTRIRYEELDGGVLRSGWLTAGKKMIRIEITLIDKVVRIMSDTDHCLNQLSGFTDKASCLKAAKSKVREMGVVIYDEVRKKV